MKTAQYVSKIKELEKHIESIIETIAQDVRQNVLLIIVDSLKAIVYF